MKRTLAFFALAALLMAPSAFAQKLKVVTTLSDLASLTQEVGGDRVEATSIARGYQDPHFVEPKPSFLLLLRNADLLEVIGLELEIGWLPPLLDQSRNPRIQVGSKGYLDVSNGVEILDRPTASVNRSMGDVHPMGNPHFWLDPANAVRIAIQIEQRLAELRPADAPYFAQRLNAFKIKINDANKRWLAEMAPYRGAKIVTYHNSWPNFAKHFGLNVVGYIEPKPGVPPSPSHSFELVNLMKAQGVKVICMEPYFDQKDPQFIAAKTGAKVVVLYPSVGGAKSGTDDYFQLFDTNIANLTKALK
jgi:ABC-type Zn uptake system ZnuABC Zn-binding protein ZnuA